jgi:two-component system, response regulator
MKPHNPDSTELLLVEDNPHDLRLALRALQSHGFNIVHVARDGAEALEYLFGDADAETGTVEIEAPRAVLLDLKLPKVDGLEVLRRLKSDPRTHNIPVVVFTSSNQERDIADCYDAGANSYVVKPLDFDEFTEAIGDLGVYWLQLNRPPCDRNPTAPL